jgi:hypothetical protein
VLVSGDIATFFYHLNAPTNPGWQYRRFQHTNNTFIDANPVQLQPTVSTAIRNDMHAARAADGSIWIAFEVSGPPNTLSVLRFVPSSSSLSFANILTAPGASIANDGVFVLPRANGNVNVFWRERTTALYTAVFSGGTWQPVSAVPNTIAGDRLPCAVEDATGALWLFWTRGPLGSGDIFLMRNDPITNGWAQPRQMTFTSQDDSTPFVLVAPNNALWAFWSSNRNGNANIFYKRLVTAL